MNRSEWTSIVLGTGVLAIGVYSGLILLGAFTEKSADSADTCEIRNHGKTGFTLRLVDGRRKLIHSRSIGRISSGQVAVHAPDGRVRKSQCPPGGHLDITVEDHRIAITKR